MYISTGYQMEKNSLNAEQTFFRFQQKKEKGGIGILNVTLCNRDHPEYGVATIPLPMPIKGLASLWLL